MRATNIRARHAPLAMLWLLMGCGDAEVGRCVAVHASPIYFGTHEPQQLTLSAEEKSSIGTVAPETQSAVCTGIVISERWILTAAHCDVGGALTFRSSMLEAVPIPVIASAVHPMLDVMLLELEKTYGAPELVPIPLLETEIGDDWIGREITLAGVGETESGSLGALRFVDEPIVEVTDLEISVDGMGSSGACVGDSGGPILVAARDGSPRVAGTLDRGSRSCTGKDVYVRADRFRAWAAEAIGGAACDAD